ncbi:hypothetical protein, partial [Streptomyces scabiei]|uniref:hypothetical protein n=1 Tax=Streptomyces scabiei TaxID=1930 RepID=UPI0029AF52E3
MVYDEAVPAVVCAIARLLIVLAAHAVVVWSAVLARATREELWSVNHQFVGLDAAVPPETNARLEMTSPLGSQIGTRYSVPEVGVDVLPQRRRDVVSYRPDGRSAVSRLPKPESNGETSAPAL